MTDQETAYRLCHHDFQGLHTCMAAEIMGVSQRRIQQLLNGLKKKSPQLFPILTQRQAKDYHLFTVGGLTLTEIACSTGRAISTVSDSIAACVKKGIPKPAKGGGMLRYDKSMDNEIKEKF